MYVVMRIHFNSISINIVGFVLWGLYGAHAGVPELSLGWPPKAFETPMSIKTERHGNTEH